jgi:phosphoglycerate dehydrogenase-like enzyme
MTRSPGGPIRKLLIVTYHRLDLWIAPEWFAERLRQEFPQLEIVRLTTYEGIDEDLAAADILFTQSLRPEQFRVARNLRWIHSPAAAIHQFLFPELVNSDVILTNAREVHGPVVAEHVMALIFALAKRIPQSVRFQQKRIWGQETLWRDHAAPAEIAGATLGLVGLGSIGRNLARRASSMGMNVMCVRANPESEKPEAVEAVLPASKLNELLGRADYVVLAIPVTAATRGIIGQEQLSHMKSDAYLINVGRGPLIDAPALIKALRERKISGVALDVFDQEPLPPDSPFWELENVLITPHTAGMTTKLWERHYKLFSDNLHRLLRGEPLLAVVDKQQGY